MIARQANTDPAGAWAATCPLPQPHLLRMIACPPLSKLRELPQLRHALINVLDTTITTPILLVVTAVVTGGHYFSLEYIGDMTLAHPGVPSVGVVERGMWLFAAIRTPAPALASASAGGCLLHFSSLLGARLFVLLLCV